MANTALPDLTAAAALAAADLFYCTQGGNSRKATAAQIQAFAQAAHHPGFVAGRWYASVIGPSVTNGTTGQNGKVTLYPFLLPRAITVSDLGSRVNTGIAAENVQLAIYAADAATFLPTGNPLAATGNISAASSNTAVEGDITGANVLLPAGLYWGGSNTSHSGIVMQTLSGAPVAGHLIGSTAIANLATAATAGTFWLQIAQAFGSWPDLTGGGMSEVATTGQNAAFLYLKAA